MQQRPMWTKGWAEERERSDENVCSTTIPFDMRAITEPLAITDASSRGRDQRSRRFCELANAKFHNSSSTLRLRNVQNLLER